MGDHQPRILAVIDTETTGLDPQKHTVVQYGMVMLWLQSLEFIRCRRTYVHLTPQEWANADPEALKVNGITPADVQDAPDRGQALDYMFHRDLPRGLVQLAFWPPEFDQPFIQAEYARDGIEWPFYRRVLDVRSVCRTYDLVNEGWQLTLNQGLQEWCKSHGDYSIYDLPSSLVPASLGPHDALYDAFLTANALRRAVLGLRAERRVDRTRVLEALGSTSQSMGPALD